MKYNHLQLSDLTGQFEQPGYKHAYTLAPRVVVLAIYVNLFKLSSIETEMRENHDELLAKIKEIKDNQDSLMDSFNKLAKYIKKMEKNNVNIDQYKVLRQQYFNRI